MENKDLRQILAILAKEIKILTRDRQALALLFAMPAFFILVMSYALEGVFEGGSSSRPVEVAVINLDRGGLSREVISDLKGLEGIVLAEALDGVPMTQERAEELVRQGQYSWPYRFRRVFGKNPVFVPGSRRESGSDVYL